MARAGACSTRPTGGNSDSSVVYHGEQIPVGARVLAIADAYDSMTSDRVYRKGCALAMLKRLSALEANPKFAKGAKLAIDRVTDNAQWFKGYRKDAIAAIGR